MCLIVLAHLADGRWPLVVAANRDEAFARETREAHWWADAPGVFGGRDLRAGGSWMAIARNRRFAAVTNLRGRGEVRGRSRGLLVADFMKGDREPLAYAREVASAADEYAGFHLLAGVAGETIVHYTNAAEQPVVLEPGIFAISNAPPGEEWPKVAAAREAMRHALANSGDADALVEALLLFLRSHGDGPVDPTRDVFIRGDVYGTRASTVIVVDGEGGVRFDERNADR